MPPKRKQVRGGAGGSVSRRNRPGWKPERGQRVMGIPEPLAFTIVIIAVAIMLYLAFS